MMYYVNAVEQIISGEALSEYSTSEKHADRSAAMTKYYQKLSNVANDIGEGKAHTYMRIEIESSVGELVKSDSLGQYLEALPEPEPEPEPEEA